MVTYADREDLGEVFNREVSKDLFNREAFKDREEDFNGLGVERRACLTGGACDDAGARRKYTRKWACEADWDGDLAFFDFRNGDSRNERREDGGSEDIESELHGC